MFARRFPSRLRTRILSLSVCSLVAFAISCKAKEGSRDTAASAARAQQSAAACAPDNGGLTLAEGFCATVFADSIGHARHPVVSSANVVYVNTWSGPYYNTAPPPGGFLLALRDTNADGRADLVSRFDATPRSGGTGGTGIALHRGALYAESKDNIIRYDLPAGALAPTAVPDTIVTGLPTTGDHPMHPFAIDSSGALYMNSGSASNSCQVKNRTLGSPGQQPCRELETRAGIWRYDAARTGQRFSPAERFARGIRNAVGIAINPADGGVYSTQHGRDQLHENWPKLFTVKQGQELPAEELLHLEQNADYGWPYCYFDGEQRKLVLAPEYGGDGKTVGLCASKREPVAFFPAHWAPNALLFYPGEQFPERYQHGAFVAFHGSWNRAPGPQEGYNVVFQPMQAGKANGPYEIFADGFAGAAKQPDAAAHRPSGLAAGPDGALYISDDKGGRIYRVVYKGLSGR
jgi:glucose/arabinose dehydrogenase